MGLIKRAVEDTARGYLATLTATKASAGSVKETLTGKDSPACVVVMSPEARDRLAQAIAEPIPAAQRGKNIRGLADIKSYSPGAARQLRLCIIQRSLYPTGRQNIYFHS